MNVEALVNDEFGGGDGRGEQAGMQAILAVQERVMRAGARDYNLQNTFELIASELGQIVDHDYAMLLSWPEDDQNLCVEAFAPPHCPGLEIGMLLPVGDTIAELGRGQLEAAICADTRHSPNWLERQLAKIGVVSCITLPLNTQGRQKDLLSLGSFRVNQYRSEDVSKLQELIGPVRVNLGHRQASYHRRGLTVPRRRPDGCTQEQQRLVAEIVQGVVHSLNNVFGNLLGNIELLQEEVNQPVSQRKLKSMQEAVLRATSITRALKQFSAQDRASNLEVLELHSLVQEVIDLTRPVWQRGRGRGTATVNKGRERAAVAPITVVHHAQEGVTVRVNRAEIKEALINIVFNAIQALPQSGRITITEGYQEDQAFVRVTDNGIGMTPEVRRRATEPFFTTRRNTSQGLGLSVASGIAWKHGGNLSIFSELHKGTTVAMEMKILGTTAVHNGRQRPVMADDDR